MDDSERPAAAGMNGEWKWKGEDVSGEWEGAGWDDDGMVQLEEA